MMNKTDSQAAIKSPFITLPEAVKATHCPRSTILKYTGLGHSLKLFDYWVIVSPLIVLMLRRG